jgi:ribosomal protein L40E
MSQEIEARFFRCAICRREIDTRLDWARKGKYLELAPVCRRCEQNEVSSGYGSRAASGSRINSGSFKDRRIASRLLALANTLILEANQASWRKSNVE